MTRRLFTDFKPRDYQKPVFDAVFNKGYRKIFIVNPRRSGKDQLGWHIAIEIAFDKTCLIYYCLTTLGHARKVIWDGLDFDGNKLLDYIPEEYIAKKNEAAMKIVLKNNSIIQLIGAESYDTALVGTNPY